MPTETEMFDRFIAWGQAHPDIRALVLTSTRTVPGARVDRLSDYDLIVAVDDIYPYFNDRGWLEAFGRVLVLYRDPILPWFQPPIPLPAGLVDEKFAYITQYEQDGLKIDFTLMPAPLLRHIAQQPLSEDLDLGYLVLLDKDRLTTCMPAPTHRAYIPQPPTLAKYLEEVELFFHECTYTAKYLWRADLIPAKEMLDTAMKVDHLRTMLEWKAEIDAGWNTRLKAHGRELKKLLPADLWAELEATYTGADIAENWTAMWRTIDLFARVARQVGEALGFAYPEELHQRCVAYMAWVQGLERE